MSENQKAAQSVGGGRAPGRRGRKLQSSADEVLRIPMWVPWDADGKGSWRLIPRSRTHNSELVEEDHGIITRRPLYEAKGFVREEDAPREAIPALVEKARNAVKQRAALREDPPAWALSVLQRHGDGEPSKSALKAS